MSITVIVNGAKGKMGVNACKTLASQPDFNLLAELGRDDNLEESIQDLKPQIVVDLTTAKTVYANTKTIIENNVHPIIGASGLLDEQIISLQKLAANKHLGGIIVPNFSIGAILMMQFAKLAAKFMPDVEIIEAHHQQKLDSPSGTALKTADMIAAARQKEPQQLTISEVVKNARGAEYKNINIHSIRLPGYLANQQVIFGNTGETLTISHNSIDRSSFMPGLILACQNVVKLDSLVYGLENLII
jgi:4-hydroxy-tetrahydrodipicolinate reductase